jgi:hypothetical protein
MTTIRVKLGPDETDLLCLLVASHPAPLHGEDCDRIAVGNLVAIGCATRLDHFVLVTAKGIALWATRTECDTTT